jgi:uncharacterized damage-inducible protein DinB
MTDAIIDIIKREFHLRVIEESLARITQCVGLLTPEQLWYKHNRNTNSIGNLVLHLEGNIRQYIVSGVGGENDVRQRSKEFLDGYDYLGSEILDKLTATLQAANAVVQAISEEQLTETVTIQGFPHTRLSAILHVIEHLSYHVGQITFYTKYVNDVDTAYYGGLDLDVTTS